VRKSVSFAELPSWRGAPAADAAGTVGAGSSKAAHRSASDSDAGSERQAASNAINSRTKSQRSRSFSSAENEHADCSDSSAAGAAAGLQSWRDSIKAHRQQQQQQQQQGPQEPLLSHQHQPVAVPAATEVQQGSSMLDSLRQSRALDAAASDEVAAQLLQPECQGNTHASSQLLQRLLQDEEDVVSTDESVNSDDDAAVASFCDPQQQQQQQQQQVLGCPGTWAPALSPVREDAMGEQASPDRSSCSIGAAAVDGLHKEMLQLRVALAAAQSELESSRQLIGLLSAEHPETAELVEAGAKQEQARQEVRQHAADAQWRHDQQYCLAYKPVLRQ
jgi:hypothetical protein